MKDMWIRWGVAFIIGATIGMLIEQVIVLKSIEKDCAIMNAFRINETPWTCKPKT